MTDPADSCQPSRKRSHSTLMSQIRYVEEKLARHYQSITQKENFIEVIKVNHHFNTQRLNEVKNILVG